MDVPALDTRTVAEALARLVANQAEPADWGEIEVTSWKEAGVRRRAGADGFVIRLPMTGQEFIVAVRERLP